MGIRLVRGDITNVAADAIVNAANPQLLPGGGVCGAIHAAAGPELARACAAWVREHGPVPTGSAAITPAFGLPARYVIHAVGPVWRGGSAGEAEALASAYREAVRLADEHRLSSVAFPSISTGIYGYPVGPAAQVAVSALTEALDRARHVTEAILVAFDQDTYDALARALSS